MPRRSKKQAKPEPESLTVRCPIRGHRHVLEFVEHPDRPDLLIAYCGGRGVAQIANPKFHQKIDPPQGDGFSYSVPSFDKGE